MPINMTVNMQPILRRTGPRLESFIHSFDGHDGWTLGGIPSPQVGIAFFWPREHAYLTVRAWYGPSRKAEFGRGIEALNQNTATLGLDPLDGDWLNECHHLSAIIDRGDEITLEFMVDTDHPRFCKMAMDNAKNNPPGLIVHIDNFIFDTNPDRSQQGLVKLQILDGHAPAGFSGFVAIDLGNTSSTVVCIPAGHRKIRDINVLDADVPEPSQFREEAPPVASVLRIDKFRLPQGQTASEVVLPHTHGTDSLRWVIGNVAAEGRTTNGVIHGAKRLMGGTDWEGTQEVLATPGLDDTSPSLVREPVRIKNYFPAELLLARLLQRFRQAGLAYGDKLVITYPTTFSSRELSQLRQTVARAWVRMMPQESTPENISKAVKKIAMELDEATAAAFFYLYRKIFETTGGLPRFQYLYPEGLNMLLYDCGGGTTDIVLVRASLDSQNRNRLNITVLARSGLRNFGGDNITIAIFKLLKAKIALELARARRERHDERKMPEDSSRLADYLKANAEWFNRLVPTNFNPTAALGADQQRSREYTFQLWQWAEETKKLFEPSGTGAPLTEVSLPPKQGDRLSEHLKTSAGESNFDVRKVVIRRSEIDALITGDIERSINCCNALIDNRLQEPGLPAPREVDWVVGVGNATRYPLFRELFDKHLKVAALDERYLLERENCKKAVAKGAVLALAMRTMAELVDIQFDSDLSNRLPYDVAYENLKSGRFRKMYDEHEKYEDMYQERQMSVLAHADHHLEDFVLMRRWPDEKDFSPFLRFHFPRGIQGSISLRYEPEEANFIAVDESNQKGERFEIELEGLYRSPLQRGDL